MPLYAGIDIGIKNLSFCVIDSVKWCRYESSESDDPGIVQWKNLNILGEPEKCQAIIKSGKKKGVVCGNNSHWKSNKKYYCGRHKPTNVKKYSQPKIKNIQSRLLKKRIFAELDKYTIFDQISSIILELQPRENQQMRMYCTSIEAYFIIRQQLDKEKPVLHTLKVTHAKNKLQMYTGPEISVEHIKRPYDRRKYLARMHTEYFLERAPEVLEEYYHPNKKCDDLADAFLYAIWAIRNS